MKPSISTLLVCFRQKLKKTKTQLYMDLRYIDPEATPPLPPSLFSHSTLSTACLPPCPSSSLCDYTCCCKHAHKPSQIGCGVYTSLQAHDTGRFRLTAPGFPRAALPIYCSLSLPRALSAFHSSTRTLFYTHTLSLPPCRSFCLSSFLCLSFSFLIPLSPSLFLSRSLSLTNTHRDPGRDRTGEEDATASAPCCRSCSYGVATVSGID